jgi:biopolymer transport protein ExbB/TolQ
MEYLQLMEPWMIPIVIMAFVTLIVLITTVGSIVKASVSKNETKDLTKNTEFLEALKEFKESMEMRVSRLERLAASEDDGSGSTRTKKKQSTTNQSIEIELGEQKGEELKASNSAKLRNMLS